MSLLLLTSFCDLDWVRLDRLVKIGEGGAESLSSWDLVRVLLEHFVRIGNVVLLLPSSIDSERVREDRLVRAGDPCISVAATTALASTAVFASMLLEWDPHNKLLLRAES